MGATSTLDVLIKEVGVRGGFLSIAGTTTASAATTITDTVNLKHSTWNDKRFVGDWLRRPAAVAAADDNRLISTYVASTGVITHDGANWSNNPSAEAYEIYTIPPETEHEGVSILSAINATLLRMYREVPVIMTLVTDGDMEESGVGDWSDTNATSSKVTALQMEGARALQVITSATNGFTQSATIDVEPDEEYSFVIPFRMRTSGNTASVILWDVTNSVALQTLTGTDMDWSMLYGEHSMGATTRQVAFRLGAVENTTTVLFDSIGFLMESARSYEAPSWVSDRWQIKAIRRRRVDDTTRRLDWEDRDTKFQIAADPAEGTTAFRLYNITPRIVNQRLYYLEALRQYAELSAGSDTTTADLETVVEGACFEIYRRLAAPSGKSQALHRERMVTHGKRFQSRMRRFQPTAGLDGDYRPQWGGPRPGGYY